MACYIADATGLELIWSEPLPSYPSTIACSRSFLPTSALEFSLNSALCTQRRQPSPQSRRHSSVHALSSSSSPLLIDTHHESFHQHFWGAKVQTKEQSETFEGASPFLCMGQMWSNHLTELLQAVLYNWADFHPSIIFMCCLCAWNVEEGDQWLMSPHVHLLVFLTKQPKSVTSSFCQGSECFIQCWWLATLVSFPTGEKKVRIVKRFEEIKENGTLL